jgi:potassium efflux system protein
VLYLSHSFIALLIRFNTKQEYALFAQDFQRRFIYVFSVLLYATVFVSLFRESFMFANYYKSELPIILLAVNFIVFQISLIFLITKDQILNLIPVRSDLWVWVRTQVDTYYYLLLLFIVAIIIMSNPYVGFGRLVLHILFAFMYTGMLLVGLIWVHALFKRVASTVFFSIEQEVVRERFANAKSWFGLIIIASFLIFSVVGVLVGAKIWGWHIHLTDVQEILKQPLMGEGSATPITLLSLLQIIGFIIAGFFVSYALNHLVLDKIFDLLLVDIGVQHTATRIMHYIVLTIAIFIGFQRVGLGQLVGLLLGALALSLGWVLKEPISDFVAYFIILVQRPIKIGDFISIDPDIRGVVRQITVRSIMLRKDNSVTIVIPNSVITSKPVVNWNYTRNFIAFDDIMITVAYKEDPARVKDLLRQSVDSHPNVLKNPPAVIRLEEFNERGFQFLVRGFISSVYTLEKWNIASDVRLGLVKLLRENNIELAVPVRIIRTNNYSIENDIAGS